MTDPKPDLETPEVLEPTPVVASDPEPTDAPPTPVEVVETPEREPDPSTEQRTSAAVVPYDRPQALVPGHDMPIIPGFQEMQGMASMAVTLAGANAVPEALRNNPNDVFQILLTARDLGVAVTTGMREFHVIKGKVTLSPKVKMAMVNERGHREGWAVWACSPDHRLDPPRCPVCGNTEGNTAEHATWHATRADRPGLTFSSTFTMAEARAIKDGSKTLADKDNWQAYPKRMLSWRAVGYLLDDVFPEVGTGLYSPDELGAMTDEQGDVIDITTTSPLPGTSAPRGHGPQAPDASDAPLCDSDPDLCTDLRARLDAIGTVPDARTALMELWTAPTGDGTVALPPFAGLKVRHKVKAMAMVQSVEARLRKGEWGPWAADLLHLADDGTTAPEVDAETPEAEPAPEVPETQADPQEACETCGATDGNHLSGAHDFAEAMGDVPAKPEPEPEPEGEDPAVREARLAKEVVAEINALGKGAVVRELATRGYTSSRDGAANQRALGAVLLRERGGTVRDDQMPPRMPDGEPSAEPLPLAPADRAAGERDE